MTFLRRQDARAPLRQPRFEQIARNRIRERVLDAFEQPVMIEQHEIDAHVRLARDFERGIDIREEPVIEARGEASIVVDDARAAVAEDEPARDEEAETRDLVEVASNRVVARGGQEIQRAIDDDIAHPPE